LRLTLEVSNTQAAAKNRGPGVGKSACWWRRGPPAPLPLFGPWRRSGGRNGFWGLLSEREMPV
jgi:hypothetical protein